jgi:hypothetical protein
MPSASAMYSKSPNCLYTCVACQHTMFTTARTRHATHTHDTHTTAHAHAKVVVRGRLLAG